MTLSHLALIFGCELYTLYTHGEREREKFLVVVVVVAAVVVKL